MDRNNGLDPLQRRVREALDSVPMTMSALAGAIGVSRALVSLWLHTNPEKRSPISEEHLAQIAHLTGTTVEWLLTGNSNTSGTYRLQPRAKEAYGMDPNTLGRQRHARRKAFEMGVIRGFQEFDHEMAARWNVPLKIRAIDGVYQFDFVGSRIVASVEVLGLDHILMRDRLYKHLLRLSVLRTLDAEQGVYRSYTLALCFCDPDIDFDYHRLKAEAEIVGVNLITVDDGHAFARYLYDAEMNTDHIIL
jgi:transcriptional regulator with XRE-family HTH domain